MTTKIHITLALAALLGASAVNTRGAGVTLITHGLNGNADGWITGMANRITSYSQFPGPDFSIYETYFYPSNNSYFLAALRVAGTPPLTSTSGQLIVKLDWGPLANGNSYNTYQIASAVVPGLLSTNFIPELGGQALASLPMHFIGHSRGGSLICEISRMLGANGVWVDHLTTLDPHPLNDPAFPLDSILYSAVDAPANTYANVLFHDEYWQDLNSFAYGKPVAGAYIRELTNLDGGYGGLAGSHSDAHLWYHGTIDWRVPAGDTEASISSSERQSWWAAYEAQGAQAGFRYSRTGGADRTNADRPLGPGFPAISEGYNQVWDLGAGTTNNRVGLTANNGNWPNLVKFNRTTTNQLLQGQSMPVKFYYQWAQPATELASIRVFLDRDFNPFNTNQILLQQITAPGNGSSAVSFATTNLALSDVTAGNYAVLGTITGAGRTRFLYAPEMLEVITLSQPPLLSIAKLNETQIRLEVTGAAGQTIVLHESSDLQDWGSFATNTLTTNNWVLTNAVSSPQRFYRAIVQ